MNEATEQAVETLINDGAEFDSLREYIAFHPDRAQIAYPIMDYVREFHPELYAIDDQIDWENEIYVYFGEDY